MPQSRFPKLLASFPHTNAVAVAIPVFHSLRVPRPGNSHAATDCAPFAGRPARAASGQSRSRSWIFLVMVLRPIPSF